MHPPSTFLTLLLATIGSCCCAGAAATSEKDGGGQRQQQQPAEQMQRHLRSQTRSGSSSFIEHQNHRLARRGSSKESLLALYSGAGGRHTQVLNASDPESTFYQLAAQNITWTTTPFNPTGVPLAVRSPYVSTWLWGGSNDRGGDLAAQFASFWNGNTLPWCGIVMVGSMPYTWMGVPANCAPNGIKATQVSLSWTSTQTTFVMRAGPVDVTATFVSPITPNDMVRQTLPYSYLNVSVSVNDGQSHPVKLYSDVTGEWVSNDWTRNITWGQYVVNNTLLVQYAQLTNETLYGEAADSTTYGQLVWATDMINTTAASGPSSSLRSQFNAAGRLGSVPDVTYRKINDDQPAFAFAKDMGAISSSRNASALFAIGHYRDPGVLFSATNAPNPQRSLYFMSAYPSMQSSIGFFYRDFAQALALSQYFDARVRADATAVANPAYADLCAIVARQVFSGCEITIGKTASGAYNTSDVMMFVKEIATSNYVNTVDVMAPAWPFFAYINPEMIRWMMQPVIDYSETVFPHPWGPHDIGRAYPIADGANQLDAPYYIEESANMLFMGLAYTRFSRNTSLISAHYPLFQKWANYLVNSTLAPRLQASTDDFAGELANMTSLAVKGVAGLGCMGALASAIGRTSDAAYYNSTAQTYAAQVISRSMASTRDHLKLTYNSPDASWSTLYNLFPDKVFRLGLFNDSLYAMQGAWYTRQAKAFGVPLDSRSENAKVDFALWTAATYANNATTRDIFINGARNFLVFGATGQAVPDMYNTVNASSTGFVNRPVVGGVYSLLANQGLMLSSAVGVSSAANAASANEASGTFRIAEPVPNAAGRRRSRRLVL